MSAYLLTLPHLHTLPHQVRANAGPGGRARFEDDIRRLLRLPLDAQFSVNFDCRLPAVAAHSSRSSGTSSSEVWTAAQSPSPHFQSVIHIEAPHLTITHHTCAATPCFEHPSHLHLGLMPRMHAMFKAIRMHQGLPCMRLPAIYRIAPYPAHMHMLR